jgi:hypothetical protein
LDILVKKEKLDGKTGSLLKGMAEVWVKDEKGEE